MRIRLSELTGVRTTHAYRDAAPWVVRQLESDVARDRGYVSTTHRLLQKATRELWARERSERRAA
jgi:hypothetical protein